jgi:hypothetical protein
VANDGTGFAGVKEWTNPSNAKVADGLYATAKLEAYEEKTQYLKATNFGFGLPEGAAVVGINVAIKRHASAAFIRDGQVRLCLGGSVDPSGHDKSSTEIWPTGDAVRIYGEVSPLWGRAWTVVQVNSSGFGVALVAKNWATEVKPTASVDAVSITIYYTEAADENRVCFATRSIELRSDGAHRQHPTDEIWGRLIPEAGSIFQAPAGGLEKRTARGIVTPSQGDLGELADAGTANLSVVPSYYPGYLYAREAA